MSETQSQALERRPLDLDAMLGSSSDPREVTQRLERVKAQGGKLISPATQCSKLIEGTAVALTPIDIDLEHDIYPVGHDKYGILKPVLDRISLAANISWNSTIRRDDGRDPHYVSCMSSGTYFQFDGTPMDIPPGTATTNLRDNSDECIEIIETKIEKALNRAKKKAKKELTAEEKQTTIEEAKRLAMREIRRRRIKIEEITETKSRLRAIRATFGIAISYTLDQLKDPFVVARLVATGESSDPVLREKFALRTFDRLTGGRRALYGGNEPASEQQAPRQLSSPTHAAPPVDDDNVVEAEYLDVAHPSRGRGEPVGGKPTKVAHAAEHDEDLPDVSHFEEADDEDGNENSGEDEGSRYGDFVIPFGSKKGCALDDSEVSMANLKWLENAYTTSIDDPEKKRWQSKNVRERDYVLAEIERRGSRPRADSEPQQTTTSGQRW